MTGVPRSFIAVSATIALVASTAQGAAEKPRRRSGDAIQIVVRQHTLRVLPLRQAQASSPAALRHLVLELPPTREIRRGNSRIRLELQRLLALPPLERAIRDGGGRVSVPAFPAAAQTWLPIVEQKLRNNCETAALSMLLVERGVRIDQQTLQRKLARSGSRDPSRSSGGLVWGDPNEGFVGRPEGGGAAGGFGVYQQPIRSLARSLGVDLLDLTGSSATTLYRQLLLGHPVMVWVGLANGPYRVWQTPSGKTLTANMSEHTVVLTGIDGQSISVNDPLTGRRLVWTRDQFERMWLRLGRRALAA